MLVIPTCSNAPNALGWDAIKIKQHADVMVTPVANVMKRVARLVTQLTIGSDKEGWYDATASMSDSMACAGDIARYDGKLQLALRLLLLWRENHS